MSATEVKFVLSGDASSLEGAISRGVQATNRLSGAFGKLAHYGVGALGLNSLATTIGNATGALYDSVTAAQRLQTALNFASGGSGATELAYVSKVANRLGLELDSTAAAYGGFAAAARGTALQGAAARQVFEAVASASAAMGLSAADNTGVLRALQQMLSKGTVSAEELRGQLGERLPGSFAVAARAMGVTTQQLGKMLEQGEILSADFLPRFAAQLQRELGDAAESAGNRLEASVNRMGNAWDRFKQKLGGELAPGANAAVQGLTNNLKAAADAMERAERAGEGPVARALLGLAGLIGVGELVDGLKDVDRQLASVLGRIRELESRRDAQQGLLSWFDARELANARARLPGLTNLRNTLRGDDSANQHGDARLAAGSAAYNAALEATRTRRDALAKLTLELNEVNPKLHETVAALEASLKAGDIDEQTFKALTAQARKKYAPQKVADKHDYLGEAQARITRLYDDWWRKDQETLDRIDAAETASFVQRLKQADEMTQGLADANERAAAEQIENDRDRARALIEIDRAVLMRKLDSLGIYGEEYARAQDAINTKAELALKALDKSVAETGDKASQQLSDSIAEGLLDGFRDGQTFAQAFLRELKAQFAKTILSPIIKPMVEAGNAGIGDLLKLISTGLNLAGAASGPTGTAGGWSFGGTTYNNPSAYIAGGRAGGGPVLAGSTYLVGERGPELLRLGALGGQVIPADQTRRAMGGVNATYAPQIRIDSRTDQAQIAQLIGAAVAEGNRQLLQMLKDKGALA